MSEDIASRDYEAEIYLLKAEIKRLGEFEAFYVRVHKLEYVAGIVKPYEEKIKRLEAEVEGMKCCGNCTYFYDNECSKFPTIDGEYCDKWESDTLTQEDRK